MSEYAQSDGSPAEHHPGSETNLNNISLEDSANNVSLYIYLNKFI